MATQTKEITQYNPNKFVLVSQELFKPEKVRWRMSTLGYRLLFALAQTLDYHTSELFPELGFKKQAIFQYLGLENNNDRYTRLAETLNEIQSKPLRLYEVTKRGAIKWSGYSWITSYHFSTDNDYVVIRLNDDVKGFLLNLKQFAAIQPKYYLRLSTEYQNWFYPYLKNAVKLGKWTVSIEQIKKALDLEDTPSYDPQKNKNANENFLTYVLGIQISEKAKIEQQKAKAEKRAARPIAWNWTTDKTGEPYGTLAGIAKYTDINVTACAVKTGRAYTDIIFFLSEKTRIPKNKIGTKEQAENDFGAPQEKGKRKKQVGSMKDIFDGIYAIPLESNPAHEATPQATTYYDVEKIQAFAKEAQLTFNQVVQKLNLQKDEAGRYWK